MKELHREDTPELRKGWNDLYDKVVGKYTSPLSEVTSSSNNGLSSSKESGSSLETSPYFSSLRDALIVSGVRPKCRILNFVLDALSLKFAELEREVEVLKRPAVCDNIPVPQQESPVRAEGVHTPRDGGETTGDEDDFFGSPSLITYKLHALQRSRASSPRSSPASRKEKSDKGVITDNGSLLAQVLGAGLKTKRDGAEKGVRRQLILDEPVSPASSAVTVSSIKVIELNVDERAEDTAPLNPPASSSRLSRGSLNSSKQSDESFEDVTISPDATYFPVPQQKKKKEAWVLPEASAHKSSSRNKSLQQKRMKQISLPAVTKSMSLKIPKKKVDVSTLKEYNGGSWSSPLITDASGSNSDVPTTSTGSKRKSDEVMESQEKRDKICSSQSDSFFETSPVKLEIEILPQMSPPPPTSPPLKFPSLVAAQAKISKPLSPSKVNIIDEDSTKSKSIIKGTGKEKFESTYDLIKDFDIIPKRGPPSPKFKYKQETVRKKAERAKMPGWECDECKQWYDGMELDEKEVERIRNSCSKHRSKEPVNLNHTPEGFWDTRAPPTQELYEKGYIRVANTPFTPPPRRVRRKSDDSENEMM